MHQKPRLDPWPFTREGHSFICLRGSVLRCLLTSSPCVWGGGLLTCSTISHVPPAVCVSGGGHLSHKESFVTSSPVCEGVYDLSHKESFVGPIMSWFCPASLCTQCCQSRLRHVTVQMPVPRAIRAQRAPPIGPATGRLVVGYSLVPLIGRWHREVFSETLVVIPEDVE